MNTTESEEEQQQRRRQSLANTPITSPRNPEGIQGEKRDLLHGFFYQKPEYVDIV